MRQTLRGTIYLRPGRDVWMATCSDPSVYLAFGTATIPTPFGPSTPVDTVIDTVQRLNPGALVRAGRGSVAA
jgi:hypothetical protein